jgi:hypothetical protein
MAIAGRQAVERLIDVQSVTLKLVALKGNHEADVGGLQQGRIKLVGREATRRSFPTGSCAKSRKKLVPRLRSPFASGLFAFTPPLIPLKQQSEPTLLWKRYPEGYPKGRRHVVHGPRRRRSSRPARPTWIVWPGRRGRLVSSTMASPVLRWTISEILV